MTCEKSFDIYVPLERTYLKKNTDGSNNGEWYVRGYASTPSLDLQGDIIPPEAINIDYFIKSGWINANHSNKTADIIGVPTEGCRIDSKGMFVEAKLFKDNAKAQEYWELANNLSKTQTDRRLGFSIEGIIKKRNGNDNRIVEEVIIHNVAITANPANTEATWESFVKSWQTGTETNPENQKDSAALRVESLARAITELSYSLYSNDIVDKDSLWSDVAEYLDKSDKANFQNSILVLQLAKGISREEAEKFLIESVYNK